MVKKIPISKYRNSQFIHNEDYLAIEEPLEIKTLHSDGNSQAISVTMRTPGDDADLALGFLYTEAIIFSKRNLRNPYTQQNAENSITVLLDSSFEFDAESLKRNFYTSSSCGVCGKESIEAIRQVRSTDIAPKKINVSMEVILSLPDRLSDAQSTFKSTGGIHAAALFDTKGKLMNLKEDVGRHNALDKVIGSEFLANTDIALDLSDRILLLSGRASFELIQKAAMAGIQLVCAFGAPSSLAVETAEEFGITLIGFLKKNSANVYTDSRGIIS